MHNPHQEPVGDGLSADQILSSLQKRSKRAATAARWIARSAEAFAELQAELATSISNSADLNEEVVRWRRQAARRASVDPDTPPPPQHYLHALRSAHIRQITVDIDGLPWTVGLRPDRFFGNDPAREFLSWSHLVAAVREARASIRSSLADEA